MDEVRVVGSEATHRRYSSMLHWALHLQNQLCLKQYYKQ